MYGNDPVWARGATGARARGARGRARGTETAGERMPRRSSLTPEEATGALESYLQPTSGIERESEIDRETDRQREPESHSSMSSSSDGFLSPEGTERGASGSDAEEIWADAENTEGAAGREKGGQAAGDAQGETGDAAEDAGGDTTEEEDLADREVHTEISDGSVISADRSTQKVGAAAGVQAALEFAERGWSEGGSSGSPATPTPAEVLRLLEEMQRTAASIPSDVLQPQREEAGSTCSEASPRSESSPMYGSPLTVGNVTFSGEDIVGVLTPGMPVFGRSTFVDCTISLPGVAPPYSIYGIDTYIRCMHCLHTYMT